MTGFFNIDKQAGVSSTFVVNKIKRLTHTPCGHMGTLDPLASGVLPVGVGNATRLFDYFQQKIKTYEARFRFGVTTDTLDSEGEKVFKGEVPAAAQIQAALPAFMGEIEQVPPKYSAVSVNGVRSYKLARAGEEVELAAKKVQIHSFSLTEQTAPDEFAFFISCGSGTYIRSLCRDLALHLGTYAYMSKLTRTQSGIFTRETAVPLEKLTEESLQEYLIPTETVLPFPVLDRVDGRIFHGVLVPVSQPDGLYKLYDNGEFYGIARVSGGLAKAEKKLC